MCTRSMPYYFRYHFHYYLFCKNWLQIQISMTSLLSTSHHPGHCTLLLKAMFQLILQNFSQKSSQRIKPYMPSTLQQFNIQSHQLKNIQSTSGTRNHQVYPMNIPILLLANCLTLHQPFHT